MSIASIQILDGPVERPLPPMASPADDRPPRTGIGSRPKPGARIEGPVRILCPYDGSAAAERALQFIVEHLEGQSGSVVHLINVQSIPILADPSRMLQEFDQLQSHRYDVGRDALAAAARRLELAQLPYRLHVALGAPTACIVECASAQHCDQIIMGSGGSSAVHQVLFGSTTLGVRHLAPVPVVIV